MAAELVWFSRRPISWFRYSSRFDTVGSIRVESCDIRIRLASSVGPGERKEGAGSSQPTSARLEGKGWESLIQSNTGFGGPGGGSGQAASPTDPRGELPEPGKDD